MSARAEAAITFAAAIFVLISAMIEPRVSAGLAVIFLLALAGYHWRAARGAQGTR